MTPQCGVVTGYDSQIEGRPGSGRSSLVQNRRSPLAAQLDQQDGAEEEGEGLHEVGLGALQAAGHVLAIATGKSRIGLERALDHSGLRPFFQGSRCADECHSKPHPQMLDELMAEFGVSGRATLMIGDTSHDRLMARNAGVDSLAVTYGAHPHDHLLDPSPLACLQTVAELGTWLKTNA